MCSIMGCISEILSKEEFKEGFEKTRSRGPNMSKLIETKSGFLGFHRLSIMGLDETGMQPFEKDGNYAICNGELYGFRKTKKELEEKGYSFVSDSDCELILPLFNEYGTDMFEMLDAEFAMIIYDSKKDSFIAARDPIGIRPLYYGYANDSDILFASEPKNIVSLVKEIFPFPPGHFYKDGEFICYTDITKTEKYTEETIDEITKNIHDKLIAGIEKRLDADAKLGFLLSGGLDSSLVCSVAQKLMPEKPIKTFAIGMEKDAIDLKYAKEVADYIGSEHTEVIITRDDVLNALDEVIKMLGTYDITTIRGSMGMYLICKEIHKQTDIRVLLTGEISDEIFGYKYTDYAPDAESFQNEAKKRLRELHMYDVLRADRCVSVNSMEARVPFGDLDFVKYIMSIDPKIKMNTYNTGKYLLRKAFEGDYLPRNILFREKAAFSDAVGHSLVDDLKEFAEKIYTDETFEKSCKKYSYHAMPFTKESLLYREIFEKYYPNQARMIDDFWMPNKEWVGCNVNDPSARVLGNYGASGK